MTDISGSKEKREWHRQIWETSDWEDVETFIGPGAHRFERVFFKQQQKIAGTGKAGVPLSWTWTAFFLPCVWFAYRKLWILAAVMFCAPFMFAYLLPASLWVIAPFAVLAISAKNLYVMAAVEEVARINARHPAGPDRDAHLISAGGVSKTAGVLTGIIFFLAVILALAEALT
jgi:hypothetical protein